MYLIPIVVRKMPHLVNGHLRSLEVFVRSRFLKNSSFTLRWKSERISLSETRFQYFYLFIVEYFFFEIPRSTVHSSRAAQTRNSVLQNFSRKNRWRSDWAESNVPGQRDRAQGYQPTNAWSRNLQTYSETLENLRRTCGGERWAFAMEHSTAAVEKSKLGYLRTILQFSQGSHPIFFFSSFVP